MTKVVLCDIDHTIANSFWRDPMIDARDWDAYHSASVDDQPLQDMHNLVKLIYRNWQIICITARPEKFRVLTMRWMMQHNIPVDEILMRPNEDFLPAPQIKKVLVEKRFKNPKDEIAFVLEDRDDCCTYYRSLGITVLQVFGRRD